MNDTATVYRCEKCGRKAGAIGGVCEVVVRAYIGGTGAFPMSVERCGGKLVLVTDNLVAKGD